MIQKRERSRYLAALRAADQGNIGALAEMIARAVLDNLYRFVVPALADPDQLVPFAALTSADVSAVALRNAAQRGRLKAQRGRDGRWRSTKAWVEDYLASRHQRASPPTGGDDPDRGNDVRRSAGRLR